LAHYFFENFLVVVPLMVIQQNMHELDTYKWTQHVFDRKINKTIRDIARLSLYV